MHKHLKSWSLDSSNYFGENGNANYQSCTVHMELTLQFSSPDCVLFLVKSLVNTHMYIWCTSIVLSEHRASLWGLVEPSERRICICVCICACICICGDFLLCLSHRSGCGDLWSHQNGVSSETDWNCSPGLHGDPSLHKHPPFIHRHRQTPFIQIHRQTHLQSLENAEAFYRVDLGLQLECGAQRAPIFLVWNIWVFELLRFISALSSGTTSVFCHNQVLQKPHLSNWSISHKNWAFNSSSEHLKGRSERYYRETGYINVLGPESLIMISIFVICSVIDLHWRRSRCLKVPSEFLPPSGWQIFVSICSSNIVSNIFIKYFHQIACDKYEVC